MQYSSAVLLAVAGLATSVSAHGFVTSPTPRMPGAAMESACGAQVYSNQESDNYGNIQGELQVAVTQSDYNAAECDIWLCKGYKYADNTANVYAYTAGETVDFTVDVRAPHTGIANVSVVDTATNTMISDTLIYWPVYASTATGVAANNTAFSVTLPDVSSECSTAGACVLQWYWYAESIDQTYESCVDFTMGSGSSSSGSSSVAASSAAATSVAATSVAASSAAATSAVATSAAVSSVEAVSSIAASSSAAAATSVAAVSSVEAVSSIAVSSSAVAVSSVAAASPTTLVTLTSSSAPSVVASSSSAAATSAKSCKRKRSQRAAL